MTKTRHVIVWCKFCPTASKAGGRRYNILAHLKRWHNFQQVGAQIEAGPGELTDAIDNSGLRLHPEEEVDTSRPKKDYSICKKRYRTGISKKPISDAAAPSSKKSTAEAAAKAVVAPTVTNEAALTKPMSTMKANSGATSPEPTMGTRTGALTVSAAKSSLTPEMQLSELTPPPQACMPFKPTF